MNFNKEIAKIISRPIHDTGCRLHSELLYAIEPVCDIELSHGIGWSCRIEWSNGSEPSLNKVAIWYRMVSFIELQYYIKNSTYRIATTAIWYRMAIWYRNAIQWTRVSVGIANRYMV